MASNDTKEKYGTTQVEAARASTQSQGSLASAFALWAKNVSLNLDVCIPAIVKEYDRVSHTAFVQPLLKKMSLETGEYFDQTPIQVTVWRYQSGGFIIDAPLFPGETGWVIASDRNAGAAKDDNCLTMEKDTMEKGKDKEKNLGATAIYDGHEETHTLETGFFIPDRWGDIPFNDGYDDSLIIKKLNKDNTTLGEITISGAGEVRLFGRTIDKDAGKAYDITTRINGKEAYIKREEKTAEEKDGKVTVGEAQKSEKLTVEEDGIKYEQKGLTTGEDSESSDIRAQKMITNVRYDMDSHQIQIKYLTQYIRGDVVVGVTKESDWEMMIGGQAEPVEEESEGSGGSESPSW